MPILTASLGPNSPPLLGEEMGEEPPIAMKKARGEWPELDELDIVVTPDYSPVDSPLIGPSDPL